MTELSRNRKSRGTLRVFGLALYHRKFFGFLRIRGLQAVMPIEGVGLASGHGRPSINRKSPVFNGLRSFVRRLRRPENIFFDSPRTDRVKFAMLSFQQLTDALFSALLAFSLLAAPAMAQDGPKPAQGQAQSSADRPADAQGNAQSAAQEKPAPNPSPVTGDALAGYLRVLAEAQAARANALQARIEAQQAVDRAVAQAQQAQGALSELVAKMAKESGAAEGMRLGLDGVWMPPAVAQGAPAQ